MILAIAQPSPAQREYRIGDALRVEVEVRQDAAQDAGVLARDHELGCASLTVAPAARMVEGDPQLDFRCADALVGMVGDRLFQSAHSVPMPDRSGLIVNVEGFDLQQLGLGSRP
ncbi:hypothetical protein LRS12_17130 [Sphingomonas sp. J344]|uniref:hypothetical protein n=1 Tax=Sphingomonas sp. J344 TaxID=2898434 RepID=UPI002150A692|nr:hypothetical protein [Sphingomonas sp. J344]MCR5872278.1 hypothetical protein [Sphingomonas sp. J344]